MPSRVTRLLISWATALLVFATVGQAAGDDTLLSHFLGSTRLPVANGRLIWFSITNGRIYLKWTELVQMTGTSKGLDKEESLKLQNENGQPRLNYERTAGDELLKIDVAGAGDDLHISLSTSGKSTRPSLDFRQTPGASTIFTIKTAAGSQTFRADDLWVLLLEIPSQQRNELLPLLDMLQPNKKLAKTLVELEANLLETTGKKAAAEQARWAVLVRQLGDDSFAQREAADRQLRSGDPAALAYLRHLDPKRFDAEQQFRIRRILEAAAAQTQEDTPQQVALSLAGVPAVWLALLDRPELTTRKTAARQLASLLGEPIDIDPVASPDSQKEKRQQLLQRIKGK